MIWILILAAGESRRMGSPKMALPFRGKTIIQKVADGALESGADGVAVVTGADRDRVEEYLKDYPVRLIYNPDFRLGMLSSVQRGWAGLPPSTRKVVVMLGDQPGIPPGLVDRLIARSGRCKKGIILPVYQGKRGHPVLIDARYRVEVMMLKSDAGLRSLMTLHPEDVEELPVNTSSILEDIDTRADYEQALGDMKNSSVE